MKKYTAQSRESTFHEGDIFVENIVQAISRDILCYAMRTLLHCWVWMCMMSCSSSAGRDASLDVICEQMVMRRYFIKN